MTSNIDFNTYKISELKKKSKKFSILIFLLTIPLFIVAFSIFNTIKDNRKIPRIAQTKNELAVRGNIISQDGFNLVSSKKLYKAVIDTRYLDFKKEEMKQIRDALKKVETQFEIIVPDAEIANIYEMLKKEQEI